MAQNDPELTARGHQQAALLAKRLADEEDAYTELLVSPARRSQETAQPIAEALALPIQTIEDLVEIRTPDYSETPEEQVQDIFREAYRRPVEEWWEGLPGGESFRSFHNRVCSAVDDILARRGVTREEPSATALWHLESERHRLLVVAHGGTNATALGYLLGAEPAPWEWERLVLGHASIARLRLFPIAGEHIISMRSFNDMEHLPSGIRTR